LTSPGREEQHLVAARPKSGGISRTRFPAIVEAEDLKEELFEGRMAIPDDLLVFLDRKEDLGPDSLSLVAAP
jgi:hypothetical protein